jgi:hypothetical protein
MGDNGVGTLKQPFDFIDHEGRRWHVPAGAVVDGASIPKPLRMVVGEPWSDRYMRASVIHDYFCATMDRGWRNVHRVFYEAMLAGGVAETKALLMYMAVMWGGPKWSIERGLDGTSKSTPFEPPRDPAQFEGLKRRIEKGELDQKKLEEIFR